MDSFYQTTRNVNNILVHISKNMEVDFEQMYKTIVLMYKPNELAIQGVYKVTHYEGI